MTPRLCSFLPMLIYLNTAGRNCLMFIMINLLIRSIIIKSSLACRPLLLLLSLPLLLLLSLPLLLLISLPLLLLFSLPLSIGWNCFGQKVSRVSKAVNYEQVFIDNATSTWVPSVTTGEHHSNWLLPIEGTWERERSRRRRRRDTKGIERVAGEQRSLIIVDRIGKLIIVNIKQFLPS